MPTVIHVFGTEYVHSLAVVNAAEKMGIINRVVVSIQGAVSLYAKHYCVGLSDSVQHAYTMRDMLKHENIYHQQKIMARRGAFEI